MTKKYNWGIIGTGWIANEMADALQEVKGKVYAVANPNEDSLQKFGTEKILSTYLQILMK